MTLARLERDEGWRRVRRRFADGAVISGWVRSEEVQPAERAAPREEAMTSYRYGTCARCGPHTYRGAATLSAGAELRTGAKGITWAVTKAEMDVEGAVSLGAEWGQVEKFRASSMSEIARRCSTARGSPRRICAG